MDVDIAVRLAAFNWLSDQKLFHGDVLPRNILEKGFIFDDERIPLVSPQGIFKPKKLKMVLSITTTPEGPYDDSFSEDGFLIYKYRGTNPNFWDNVALRNTFKHNRPLIYFHGIVPGQYLAVWPVYIIEDDPKNFLFKVAVDDIQNINLGLEDEPSVSETTNERRAYITLSVKQRLLISDNHTTRTTTNRIPVFFRGLVDYPGQGGLDGNGSTSEEINGISEERKN